MKNTSEYVVQTLIDDEDMSADLASLSPAASKIGDAAAAFIDKADQTIEKKGLMGTPAFDVVETHRRAYPHHQTSVIPTKTSIIVKGTSK